MVARPSVAVVVALLPWAALAQQQLSATELARAKSILERSRAELNSEQFALLSSRLAETERAYVELAAIAEAAGAATTAAAGTSGATMVAAGGRAVLSGVADLLPLFILVWPSTAHAPGLKEEKPQVRAARKNLEERVKALAEAARQVDMEMQAAASRAPKAAPGRKRLVNKPPEDRDGCVCICGPPKAPSSQRQHIGRYAEWRCRSICVEDYGFKYNEYACQ